MIEELLNKPYWIIDILPEQVPAYSPGQYSSVEQFYLKEPQKSHLLRSFLNIFLKLNCYVDIRVSCDFGKSWEDNPIPDELEAIITKDDNSTVYVLFPESDTLASLDKGDTNMTVFNPGERLLNLFIKLAGSEGLFVWQPPIS
jgi:hypothetical protein